MSFIPASQVKRSPSAYEDDFSSPSALDPPNNSFEPPGDAIGVFVDLNDASSHSGSVTPEVDDTKSVCASQFPDVDKCIPRWKEIFPWVFWLPEKGRLYCKQCRDILRTYIPGQVKKSMIIQIVKPDDVFLVARLLRKHNDSETHSVSHCLSSSSSISSLILFYRSPNSDIGDTVQLINAAKVILNDSNIDQMSFINITKFLGSYAENFIIESLRSAKYFSVVADQCRGLIIARYLNKDNEPEEHVLWSYISIWDMTPLTYLNSLDLDFKRMIIYIANIPCQQCRRCTSNRTTQANLPPRPPSIRSFSNFMWNLDFFKPLVYVLESVLKLWKLYPYMFSKKFSPADIKTLENFYSNPGSIIHLIKNFDSIKEICGHIYQGRYILEALGVTMIEIQSDEKHLKILAILQEIMDIASETSKSDKIISDKVIVKLNQALSSLKYWSSKAQFVTVKNTQPAQDRKATSDKVWEFINLVEKFIDENQKGIYYNGKENIYCFVSLCYQNRFFNNGRIVYDREELRKSFGVVYNALSPFLSLDDQNEMIDLLIDFYFFASIQGGEIKSCLEGLAFLDKHPDQLERFAQVHKFFLLMAALPFQPCNKARSLFGSFVTEQKIDNSVWNKFKEDLKPWVLYLQQVSPFSHKNVLSWWLESFDSQKS